ncbi:uncharacterized protein [Halyomorpha halys]|uniref:uncharacterized protein isoform X2 n=1 Tax=Halyomorpha halys TaxID=286706 RepID=UPI0034D2FE49
MDSISLISDRSKTKSEEYYTKLLNKNCEIFKALDLNNWKEIKKKERNECAHYLKKWKCYSAACALESCTRSFMDSIECLERKMTILSELKKSNKMITESEEMYKVMKKGSTFNKENVSTMKNNYLLKRDVAKYPVSDLYISEELKKVTQFLRNVLEEKYVSNRF